MTRQYHLNVIRINKHFQWKNNLACNGLANCGLVPPYGDIPRSLRTLIRHMTPPKSHILFSWASYGVSVVSILEKIKHAILGLTILYITTEAEAHLRYRDPHHKDKMVVRPSYLYDGNSNTSIQIIKFQEHRFLSIRSDISFCRIFILTLHLIQLLYFIHSSCACACL